MIRKQAEYRACFSISWYNELLYFTTVVFYNCCILQMTVYFILRGTQRLYSQSLRPNKYETSVSIIGGSYDSRKSSQYCDYRPR